MENNLLTHVGNTPMLEFVFDGIHIFGKAEFMNPGGSVKDRLAKNIILNAEKEGLINPGDTLIEATSGNTGIALAMFSANMGYKMKIVMPSNMSEERKQMFKMYGAELIEVNAGDFEGAIALRDKLAASNNWFNCNQFHSKWNTEAHYATTGPEIFKYVEEAGHIPNAFVLGTGTGGTLMGAGQFLKEMYPEIKIVAVEPAESPVMSGGQPGIHGIQGIGDGSKYLVDMNFVNDVVIISTEEAKQTAKTLAREHGIFIGISAGANVLASVKYAKKNGYLSVLTILCDRGERYFSCF